MQIREEVFMEQRYQGVLTTKEEFLFPDSIKGDLPKSIRLVCAKNGKPGIQLILQTLGENGQLTLKSDTLQAEWFCMKKVPVEYNTGDGKEQEGDMVILPKEQPSYAIKKAPFWVYDCLQPAPEGIIQAEEGQIAVYFCLSLKENEKAGQHKANLEVQLQEGVWKCEILLQAYDVEIPQESFGVTTWYSIPAIERNHAVKYGTGAMKPVLQSYISAMRRMRQNTFFVHITERCVVSKDPWQFDFSYLYSEISAFFEGGMKTLEIGGVLSRGFLPDGKPDMMTDTFKCNVAPEIPLESPEGYEITTKMMAELAKFLKQHGWDKNVLLHIHDEPDVHYPDERALEERRRQYYMAVGIVKKYLPECKIIEAVKTTTFRGCIDIWVPVTSTYEQEKEAFDKLANLGEEVWCYVCCVPQGEWLNRFLDKPLLESRILLWGCEKNQLQGYLHWGLNQFPEKMNPFEATSCHNPTGLGTNFPCGDAFIVYPSEDGAWISMRLESQRRGTEDLELLKLLRQKDLQKHDILVNQIFENNCSFEKNPEKFALIYEEVLKALEK